MRKIPRTKRHKYPVYRLGRNVNNEGRQNMTTEYEISLCEVREEDEHYQNNFPGAITAN